MLNPGSGGPFAAFYQLAYVTTDLEQALEIFKTRYDVPNVTRVGELALQLDGGGTTIIRLALCFVGQVELEIIEPVGGEDNIYRQALPDSGFGLVWHHVGFRVPSLDALEQMRSDLQQSGHTVALSGGTERASWFYADARSTLGHFLEYIYLNPAGEAFRATLARN